MRIGELAKATGVDVETIRYYEKVQLLNAPSRSDNGYRVYTKAHLERLSFIRHCRALDIPLSEVKRLLSFLDNPESECSEINHLVDAQLAKVRARLASMQALERQLMALRGQCSTPHTASECGILHELVAAAHGEACACHHAPKEGKPLAETRTTAQ
ncbi:MAG: Cd(II)/Pb(II)-responsive transcriptional regulator [Burkholderiaceae bacterium]|nr:MAG: Cd(II)/Pb(II)-responsive transcriptional regulator [Burkholderiaceae bacterium]